jgi:hypothetical protein
VPQPFITGPRLLLAQYVAALGAKGVTAALVVVPVAGLLAPVLVPGAEALWVVAAADRLGPYRSSLFWPVLVSYAASTSTAAVGAFLVATGLALTAPGLPLVPLWVAGLPVPLALVVAGTAVAAVGVGVSGVGAGVALLGAAVASPMGSMVSYHLTRRPKRLSDSGAALPRLLPPGKTPRLPIPVPQGEFGEDGDDDDDDGALPVRSRASPGGQVEERPRKPGDPPPIIGVPTRPGQRADGFVDAAAPVAPARPAPWLKSPFIYVAQVVGGAGMRALALPCMAVPGAGPCLGGAAGALAEAYGVAWVGDRVGDGRAPLLAPAAGSLLVGGLSAVAWGAAQALVLGAVVGWTAVAAWVLVARVPVGTRLPAVAAASTAGGAALVGAGAAALAGMALLAFSPLAATALYQVAKARKEQWDNGTHPVGLVLRADPSPPPGAAPPPPPR